MAKEEVKKVSEGQNPDGVNFDAKEMISKNAEAKTVIRYKDRVKVRLLKDTTYQKKGKEYSPFTNQTKGYLLSLIVLRNNNKSG